MTTVLLSSDHLYSGMQSQSQQAVLDRLYNDVQVEGNLDILPDIVTDDVNVSSIAFEGAYSGIDEYRHHFSMMETAFDDVEVSYEVLAVGDDTLTVESRFSGTHVGPFMEIEATGNQVSYPGIDVITFEDGRISSIRSAFDFFKLLSDIGVVSLPPE